MIFRQTIASAAILLSLALPLRAQKPGKLARVQAAQGGVKAQRNLDRAIDGLQHALNLRPDQVSQLRSLLDTRQSELRTLGQKFDKKSIRDLKERAGANREERRKA